MSLTYTVHELPSDVSTSPTILQQFQSLRLSALHTFPSASLYIHPRESAYTSSDWIAILTDPLKHHFICVAHGPSTTTTTTTTVRTTDAGTWVGMLTLRGPLSRAQFDIAGVGRGRSGPEQHGDDDDDELETRWGALGLYLQPGHRVNAAHVRMHEAVLAFVRAFTDEELPVKVGANGMEKQKRARVRGTVKELEGNTGLKMLYESWGGLEVGRMTKRENLVFAGEEPVVRRVSGEEDVDGEESTVYEVVVPC